MKRDDYAKAIKNQGFKLVNNPPGDFNCQLAALTHKAKILGILRSPETMSIMNKIVSSLKSNPYDSDGFPLLDHLADDDSSGRFLGRLYHSYGARWNLWEADYAVCRRCN